LAGGLIMVAHAPAFFFPGARVPAELMENGTEAGRASEQQDAQAACTHLNFSPGQSSILSINHQGHLSFSFKSS
jgi:hypothetical protein